MARHETASSKPNPDTVANIENPAQAEDLDQYGGGWAGATGGSAAQVFEVTNLPIPAGTDWRTGVHVLGTVTVPPGARLLQTYYLELAAPIAAADFLTLAEFTDPADWSSNDAGALLSDGTSTVARSDSGVFLLPWTNNTGNNQASTAPAVGGTLTIGLAAMAIGFDGPTTADMTVVRARAAILVL